MSLNSIQQAVLSYFLANGAADLNIAGRFYPRGELDLIIEDKIAVATRKFGRKVSGNAKPAAVAFLDQMIAREAWSTKENEFGGTMHQFQPDQFKTALKEIRDADALAQEGQGKDADFWTAKFEALTAA